MDIFQQYHEKKQEIEAHLHAVFDPNEVDKMMDLIEELQILYSDYQEWVHQRIEGE